MTITATHDIHTRVRIKELNCDGVVLGYYYDGDGLTYRVRYFYCGKPETVYFMEDELSPAPQFSPPIGLAVKA